MKNAVNIAVAATMAATRATYGNHVVDRPRNILFICSRNRIRSLTAERLLAKSQVYHVRSAGVSPQARIRVNSGHLGWADAIFVMEKRHGQMLRAQFPDETAGATIVCLNVPDDYSFMDGDLIELLLAQLEAHLGPIEADIQAAQ